jgi:hypothetical protein
MNTNKIKKWFWLQKEGAGVGIGIALLLYYLKWDLPIKLPFEGITKLIVMILIFGIIGMLIDAVWEPKK